MSDQPQKEDTNQPPQQQTTPPTQEGTSTTDFSLGRRFVGNSEDKVRKKDNPQ
ncbi:TPA: hypothetical protein MYS43_003965 [Klebsiella pneumoniae]|nr:hypothetical protein [Klebsiella pneumoniae]HDZ0906578.1 hypothetical protein [Klebsiella pneumoniae]